MLCPMFEPMEQGKAELELARRYFANYGPASLKDAAYFFGTTQKQVKGWLDGLPVETVQYEGRTLFFMPRKKEWSAQITDCLFLAGFDPLMLGYEKRENPFLLQQHIRGIYNLAGIVMPAVLLHGNVAGKWKNKGSTLEVTLFEPVCRQNVEYMVQRAKTLWPDKQLVCIE